MAGNYERGLFKQYQDVMTAFEKLSAEFAQFKTAHQWEIAAIKGIEPRGKPRTPTRDDASVGELYPKRLKEAHRQEISALKETHRQEVARLEARITSLETENALLKARINKDSGNSGKPPSSDGLKKPKPQNSREKSSLRPGGQPGHKGHTATLCETPDEIIKLNAETCGCGGEIQYPNGVERRQHVDLQIHAHIRELLKMTWNMRPLRSPCGTYSVR